MNAVLRITMTYFSIVPLQKWLSIAGAILVAVALLLRTTPFAIAAILGAVFIVLVPAFLGGTSMRYGSSRSTLQLRPGSRWKMLAGALLTVCLMTAICAFTMWAGSKAGLGPPSRNPSVAPQMTPTLLALALWGGFSVLWLASFVASGSGLWAALFGIGFIAMNSSRWEPLKALGSPPIVLVTVGAVCWLVFAFWYLRVRGVRRPGRTSNMSLLEPREPMGLGENTTGGWYSSLTESRGESRTDALRAYLLGTSSYLGLLMPGLLSALVILPLYYLLRRSSAGFLALPVVLLTILAGSCGSLTYMVTRRARTLWLRAGFDRAGLFMLSERIALQGTALMFVGAAVVLAGFSIAARPDQGDRILVFAMAQLAYAMVLFYFGLSQTRDFSAATVFGYIGLGLGLIVQMILLLPQTTGISPIVAPILMGISLLLALMLRSLARARWLSIDWHLTRPPIMRREAPDSLIHG